VGIFLGGDKMKSVSNKITAIYVRVANKNSHKDLLEHQRSLCEEKARMEDLEGLPEFIYEDCGSGISIAGREGLKSMLEDAKKGLFSTVICTSLSRFSRDALDAMALKHQLVKEHNIRLITIEEGYDSKNKEEEDEIVSTIISAINQKLLKML
jgi:site-specific DNA recombinase